jgi:LacI family transcriptional regulator
MPTIKDVAALAGVAAGTVSNVLNRPSYVNQETRQKVQDAIQQLGYSPRPHARQYRPGRVRNLGIAVANLDNPFFVDVALGAEEFARECDAGVVICNSGDDPVREDQNLDLLVQQRVQGLIISPVDENSSRIQQLRDRGVPMVFVDRVSNLPDCWSVIVNDSEGGRLAMNHLLDKGHESIALVGHPEFSPKVRARFTGAIEAFTARKPDYSRPETIDVSSWTVDEGRRVAKEISQRPPAARPTAIISANDLMALGMLQVFDHLGIEVPRDIALVGYDDVVWAGISMIPLTTIRQPRHLLGRKAVEMIMELLDNPTHRASPRHVVLSPELIVRETA